MVFFYNGHIKYKATFKFKKLLKFLAGLARFELAHARVKVWCLTAWLQSNMNKFLLTNHIILPATRFAPCILTL